MKRGITEKTDPEEYADRADIESDKFRFSESFTGTQQRLPCVKGAGTAQAVTEGLCSKKLRIFR